MNNYPEDIYPQEDIYLEEGIGLLEDLDTQEEAREVVRPAFPFPIEPIDISLARLEVAGRIGRLPFGRDEECTRSLWVVFAGDWGVWTRAVIPVDDRLDAGEPGVITARCAQVADLLVEPDCYGVVIAAVVLRRPAPAKPTRADRTVARLLAKAAASRDTVPWSFLVAGPDGFYPISRTPSELRNQTEMPVLRGRKV